MQRAREAGFVNALHVLSECRKPEQVIYWKYRAATKEATKKKHDEEQQTLQCFSMLGGPPCQVMVKAAPRSEQPKTRNTPLNENTAEVWAAALAHSSRQLRLRGLGCSSLVFFFSEVRMARVSQGGRFVEEAERA